MSDSSVCPRLGIDTSDCSLVINSDISGVGVRVSFYLQTFFLVLLVDRSWQDAPQALWTFIATSFGLTIAALVQVNNDTLTLFQALQVMNLVWLANFGTFLSLASYSRKREKDHSKGKRHKTDDYVKQGAMGQTTFSMILTLLLWARSGKIVCQRDCASTVNYLLFAWGIKAVSAGRIVGLTLASLLTAIYLVITLHELKSYRRARKQKKKLKAERKKRAAEAKQATIPPPLASPPRSEHLTVPVIPHGHSQGQSSSSDLSVAPSTRSRHQRNGSGSHSGATKHRPSRRRWFTDLDPMLVGIGFCQLVVFTYFIVSSELLITRNLTDDTSNAMGFGQILAIIAVVPSAVSVWNAFRKVGVRRLNRSRDKRERRRRQRKDRERRKANGEKSTTTTAPTIQVENTDSMLAIEEGRSSASGSMDAGRQPTP